MLEAVSWKTLNLANSSYTRFKIYLFIYISSCDMFT